MAKLAPSLLSANFANLESDINLLEENGIEYLHLDVMDGHFVPNITFGPGLIKSIRKNSNLIFDTHLMIDRPERFIKDFAEAGSDIITVHQESTIHLHRVIQEIKSYGKKAGVSLNPSTPLDSLNYVFADLDLVLIMSVNPGYGGQSFIPQMKEKLKALVEIKERNNFNFTIAIDGGVKTTNVKEIADIGAELIISGSDVFGASDISSRIKEYYEILNR